MKQPVHNIFYTRYQIPLYWRWIKTFLKFAKCQNIMFRIARPWNLGQWWLKLKGFLLPSHMYVWLCGHLLTRDKTKMLCVYFTKLIAINFVIVTNYLATSLFFHVATRCQMTKENKIIFISTKSINIKLGTVVA